AAFGVRDVDLVLIAGEAQREPFLCLPAVLALPGLADDVARDVVAQPILDLAELLDRADIGLLAQLAPRRRPWVLAPVDAALRQLPDMGLIRMLGSVDAAADEHAAVAVEHRGADAGPIGQGFEGGHGDRTTDKRTTEDRLNASRRWRHPSP